MWSLVTKGPLVVSPKMLNGLIFVLGMPQASGSAGAKPGIPNSEVTLRTPPNGVPNVLAKPICVTRNSLTIVDEKMRLLEIISCRGWVEILVPVSLMASNDCTSDPQL